MKSFITVLITGILFLYPFAIYFGLNYFSPSLLALMFLTFLSLRLFIVKSSLAKMPWILPATILGAIVIIASVVTDSYVGFKLYPLMVNVAMLSVFAYSYIKPPTVIESLARLKENYISAEGVSYISKVTLVWCVFFIINGSISLYTALFASLDTWILYNGFISYVLMAIIMAFEFLIRRKVKMKHSSEPSTCLPQEHEASVDE